ncbi:hypothetical protein RchiOBHm_Chr4g0387741 [Rosa chinensis]|uniref:Uncharacterized protein n=1 Tax=Rosa chinensis TaxID=74649 RepID=A0A2P6QPL7_ROSCH|nr:hypothetical protein RchiOBHm_Chr4g0387741 [Rosa chinensis]
MVNRLNWLSCVLEVLYHSTLCRSCIQLWEANLKELAVQQERRGGAINDTK